MGQTLLDISSTVVASGYANLVGVSENTARICFAPHLVCARLAMCFMDERWRHTPKGIELKGKSKTWWVEKAKKLFLEGLCTPEKGDFAKVMVGLYFLFCADEERHVAKNDYLTFSVPFNRWVERLVGEDLREEKPTDSSGVWFSAIQICRNYLSSFDENW